MIVNKFDIYLTKQFISKKHKKPRFPLIDYLWQIWLKQIWWKALGCCGRKGKSRPSSHSLIKRKPKNEWAWYSTSNDYLQIAFHKWAYKLKHLLTLIVKIRKIKPFAKIFLPDAFRFVENFLCEFFFNNKLYISVGVIDKSCSPAFALNKFVCMKFVLKNKRAVKP